MKNKMFYIVFIFLVFSVTGCGSLSIKPVDYSYADNDSNSAKLTFLSYEKVGVTLIDYNDRLMPVPAQGTRWTSTVRFPAGKPLDIRVIVYWKENIPGERRRGIFKCPPLEAGKEYKLSFKGNYKNGGSLTLTKASAQNASGEVIYEQIIPPMPKQ